jgi:HK97 family phage major capsid protein
MPKTLKLGRQTRQFELDLSSLDEEARTIEVSFSSELPVKRWYGMEILGHKRGEVRLEFANAGAAVCDGHYGNQVGVTEKAWIEASRGKAKIRFARDDEGEKKLQRVKDGICRWISCYYQTHKMQLIKADKETGVNTYRAIDWEPLTIDFVVIPADVTVGVGRAAEDMVREIPVIGGETMDPCKVCGKEKAECTCSAGWMSSRSVAIPDPGGAQPPAITPNPAPAAPALQVRQLQEQATTAERDRVTNILALGRQWKKTGLAEKHVRENTPLDSFRTLILEELKTGPNPPLRPVKETDADLGLGRRDLEKYSVLRLCRAQAEPQDRSAQEAAAFEFECSSAYQERALKEGLKSEFRGVTIPPEVLRAPVMQNGRTSQGRAFSEGNPDGGGYLVETRLEIGSMMEYLWKRIVGSDRITKFTGLIGNVLIPKEIGEAACYWIAEDGTPTEASADNMFGQVAMVSKTLAARAGVTRKLLLQTSLDMEAWLRRHIGRKFGSELERVLFVGSGGSGEPVGIFNVTGVGSASFSNGAISHPGTVQLWAGVANSDADVADMVYITNAAVAGQAAMIEKASGYPVYILSDTKQIFGYPCLVTNHVPRTFGAGANRSGILFGNLRDAAVGLWGGMDIIVDKISSNAGQVIIKAFQDADIVLLRAQSFAVATDIDHTLIQ